MLPFFSRIILRLLFGVQVHGRLDRHDKLLLVANHQSFLDGALLGAFLPVMPVWLLHTTMARLWYFRIPMKLFPHLVVDTANPLAMKALVALVESGRPVLIFAEGRITVTGGLMKIYDGPAWVAARTGATLVPIHIDGPRYTGMGRMSGDFPRKRFPRITLTIGAPCKLEMPVARTAKLRRRMASERLRRIMQESAFAARKRTTLVEAFLDAIELHGRGRDMLEDVLQPDQTYGQLLKTSLALGRIASKLTQEGEYVGVLMPNAGTTACLLYGLLAQRRVPAILNYTSGLDGMQSACRMTRAKLVITSRAFLEKARLEATVAKLEGVRVVYLEDLRSSFTLADKLWLVFWALRFPRRTLKPAKPEDPAVVLFTSGSEGTAQGRGAEPRLHSGQHRAGPRHPGRHVQRQVHELHADVSRLRPQHRRVPALLLRGAHVPVPFAAALPHHSGDDLRPELHRHVRDEHVPGQLRQARAPVRPAQPAHHRSRGREAERGCAGSVCREVRHPHLRRLRRHRMRADCLGADVSGFSRGHGGRTAARHGSEDRTGGRNRRGRPAACARAQPDAGLSARDGARARSSRHRRIFGEGWYSTGDIASIDDAGYLTLRGRVKRFAKVAGEMVSLETAEAIAVAASPNSSHAAVAVEEPGRGEVVVLFTEDPALKRDALKQAARDLGLPELALARRVVHLKPLPLLGNGKRDYVTLNRLARA